MQAPNWKSLFILIPKWKETTPMKVAVIVLVLTVALAAGSTGALGDAPAVKVGVIEMLTGGSAFYGNAVLEGIKVAVTEINASGGINGKSLELVVKDNASDNAQAAALTAQLAGDKSIPVGVTPTYQPNFNAACARANADSFPMVSAQSGPPDPKNNRQGWCWTMTTDPIAQATYTFKTLKESKGWKNFVMVYDQDNGYVAFQRPNIRESAKDAGVNLQEIGVAAGTSDFGAQITQAMDAHADAVFPFFTIEDAARFMKQARQRDLTTPWFDPVSQLTSKRLPELSGGAATGLLASTPQSADDIPSFKAFLGYYTKVNGKQLDDPTYTGFGYDALRLIAQAMKDAGTTTDRAAIKAQIDKYKTPCFSICFAGHQDIGAFLADKFYLVRLSATEGFVRP
jgi:branched-chain amino acid transport system substrate-binding protein